MVHPHDTIHFCLFYLTDNSTDIGTQCPAMDTNSDKNVIANTFDTITILMIILYFFFKNSASLDGDFDWNSEEQGLILGSFFYGNIVTQIPGGYFSEIFGGKWIFSGGILISGIACLFTPLATQAGTSAFIALRVIQGLGQVQNLYFHKTKLFSYCHADFI